MSDYQLFISVPITEEFLALVLTTALEGGVGYWLQCGYIHRDDKHHIIQVDGLYDAETDEDFDQPSLDLGDVYLGIKNILEGNIVWERFKSRLLRAVTEKDGICSLDVEDCDTIVQVALFGEVIYG
jgi:hypothetical protein